MPDQAQALFLSWLIALASFFCRTRSKIECDDSFDLAVFQLRENLVLIPHSSFGLIVCLMSMDETHFPWSSYLASDVTYLRSSYSSKKPY